MLVPIVFSGRWTTVDGWNPALIDGLFIPLFTGFYTSQVVVWDFFHQQYGPIQTISEYIGCQEAWLLYRHAILIVVTGHIQGVITVYFPLFRLKMLAADEVHNTRTHLQVLLSVSCKWTPTKDLLLNSAQCQRGDHRSKKQVCGVDGSEATVEALKDESLKWPFWDG